MATGLLEIVDLYLVGREVSLAYGANLRRAVTHWGAFIGRPPTLADLTDDGLSAFLAWQRRLLDPVTVNNKRRCLLTLWRFAWRRRLVAELPRDVLRAREPRRLPNAWTVMEVSAIARTAATAGPWWESLVLAAYYTAARIGSLLAVEWQDVALDDGWLVLRAEASKVKADEVRGLPPSTVAALRRLGPGEGLVWPLDWHRSTFFRRSRCLFLAAGVLVGPGSRETWHRLRRSRLTHLAAVESLEAARLVAGHSDVRVTARCYIDPRATMRPVAEVL